MNDLNHKETILLSKISLDGFTSQREISQLSGFSLGLINILLKNLVNKGYVKLSRLNKKNIQYVLTPKGFKEQIRLTRLYIQDTFDRINNYKKWLSEFIDGKIIEGYNQFILLGENELLNITEVILKNNENISYAKISRAENILSPNMMILDCQDDNNSKYINEKNYMNITQYIAQKLNKVE